MIKLSTFLSLAFVSATLFACAAESVDATESADDLGETSAELANNGGGPGSTGLTAGECTGCGCSLVLVEKTDSCRYYKCVCETDAQRDCALGKAASMTVTVPNTPRVFTGAVKTATFFSTSP